MGKIEHIVMGRWELEALRLEWEVRRREEVQRGVRRKLTPSAN